MVRFGPFARYALIAVVFTSIGGCSSARWFSNSTQIAAPVVVDNPLFVPVPNHELVWSVLVDSIDDYFKIQRESPVRIIDGAVLEGHLETYPRVGSTVLEPWRKDSTRGFERLHATLQSVRRRAVVRVIPNRHGYAIDLVVTKELEDVAQPEGATVGRSLERHDTSLIRPRREQTGVSQSLGWIPIGRDVSLEQQILQDLKNRFVGTKTIRPLPPVEGQ